MSADNTRFDLTAVLRRPALEIAFASAAGGKATHWKHDKENNRILLAWSESAGKDFIPFFNPLGPEEFAVFLKGLPDMLEYGRGMDHDGDSKKSFRIYNESWNHVGSNQYVFAAIEPAWAEYGK